MLAGAGPGWIREFFYSGGPGSNLSKRRVGPNSLRVFPAILIDKIID